MIAMSRSCLVMVAGLYSLILFVSVIHCMTDRASSSNGNRQQTFKDQVSRPLQRNPSLQLNYAKADSSLSELEKLIYSDKEQTLLHNIRQPKQQQLSPTRERVALYRQKLFDNLKHEQNLLNAGAEMHEFLARKGSTPLEDKETHQLIAGSARHAAQFADKKAKKLANNPNLKSTSHLVKQSKHNRSL